MFKIENMAGITARIGRHFLKLKKPDIRQLSHIKTFKDNFTKTGFVMTTVAAGCVVTSIAGYVVYTRKDNCPDVYTSQEEAFQTTPNKLLFKAFPKGLIIDPVKIDVGPNGTTVKCRTDLDGGTDNEHIFTRFKNDKYKFIPQKDSNPKVSHEEETNISTIVFNLSEIKEQT